jgi:Ca-activated chloride channel family protein
VIKNASERGVKIFTVGIGTAEGELIPAEGGGFLKDRKGQVVKSRLGEETLKKIALDTGGVYLHAAGADLGLGELYRDHIATMEKRDLASTLERRYEHRYQIPLALAVLLLVVEQLLGERRLERRGLARRQDRVVKAATLVLLVGVAGASRAESSWIDPHATARSASKLYDDGKFGDSAAKYREALVDDPTPPSSTTTRAWRRTGTVSTTTRSRRSAPYRRRTPIRSAPRTPRMPPATRSTGSARPRRPRSRRMPSSSTRRR